MPLTLRHRERRESRKNVRPGRWGEGVQNALFGAQHNHCKHGLTAAQAAWTRLGWSTANHGLKGDHGPYHCLMSYGLSGGETSFSPVVSPLLSEPAVFQTLDTSKLMIHRWACLESVNRQRIPTDLSVGNRVIGKRGTDSRWKDKSEVRATRTHYTHLWNCKKQIG